MPLELRHLRRLQQVNFLWLKENSSRGARGSPWQWSLLEVDSQQDSGEQRHFPRLDSWLAQHLEVRQAL